MWRRRPPVPSANGEPLRAVLFDFADTLINFSTNDWRPLFEAGIVEAHRQLLAWDLPTPPVRAFARVIRRNLVLAAAAAKLRRQDFNLHDVLVRTLASLRLAVTGERLEALALRWYSPAFAIAEAEPKLDAVLAALQFRGLRLGILSNTIVPGYCLDRHLIDAGVIEHFDARLYTSETRVRKPQTAVFRLALSALRMQPGETVFVGNSPDHDIRGAQRVGMRTVLKRRYLPRGRLRWTPTAAIDTLSELPAVLDAWGEAS